MYQVTTKFLEYMLSDHSVKTKVEVTDIGGNVLHELEVETGYVRTDKSAANRGQFDATLHSTDLIPSEASDLLHPFSGHEIRPYRGILYPDGTEELVPLGVYGIEDANIQDSGEKVEISLKGFDRSKTVQDRRWTEVYSIAEGTNAVEAIENLIRFKLPTAKFNSVQTSLTVPPLLYGGGINSGGDPWEAVESIAEGIGYEVFFDGKGECVLRPEPSLIENEVIWSYNEGEYNTLLNVDRSITRDNAFSHVIVIGNHTALFVPIRVDVYDNNPDSPTYFAGPFGDVPTWLESRTIFSEAAAQEAGSAHLRSKSGVVEGLQLVAVVNPAHEIGDVITIQRSRVGLQNSRHIMDKVTIPLEYNQPLNVTCRENRGIFS